MKLVILLSVLLVAGLFLLNQSSQTPNPIVLHTASVEMETFPTSQLSLDGNSGSGPVLLDCGLIYGPACGGQCGIVENVHGVEITTFGQCTMAPLGGCYCKLYLPPINKK